MKLSRTFTYAVQAVLELCRAPADQTMTCKELAEQGGMPERFLLQILRSLVTKGLLASNRGVRGGYRLNREAQEITMLDVLEAVEGAITFDLPPRQDGKQHRPEIGVLLGEARDRIRRELASIRICPGAQRDEDDDDGSTSSRLAAAG